MDRALTTTHANVRIFLITAKYCTFAVWLDESQRLVSEIRRKGLSGMSLGLLWDYFWVWWYAALVSLFRGGCLTRFD